MNQFKNILLIFTLLFKVSHGFSQFTGNEIRISQPIENQVIQRDLNGNATVFITGYYNEKLSTIEGRLISERNSNPNTPWQTLVIQAEEGFFKASLEGNTGWHKLEIRGTLVNGSIILSEINRIGIGEIFLIGGASNSMGMTKHGSKGASSNVISFNQVNKTLNDKGITVVPDQPYDFPVFTRYEAENSAYPTGESAWCWGELGDKIFQKTGSPVLFLNAGWAAANSADYRTNTEGKDAFNFYVGHYWPFKQPFTNIVNTLKYFNSWLGIRSILWAHGETDAEYTNHTQKDYVNNITQVIHESREAFGQNVNWSIAVGGASLGSSQPIHPITHAQIELAQKAGLNTWRGPNTDTVQVPRFDGHFANINNGVQGLSQAAEAWNRNMSADFFNSVTPITPRSSIHTGAIPSRTFPGATFPVAFQATNIPLEQTQFQVELMNENGKYAAVIGYGKENPMWVTMPSEIPNGDYRIRITAGYPFVLPGSISEIITVDSTAKETQIIRNFKVTAEDNQTRIQWLHTAYPDLDKLVLQKSKNSFQFSDIASFDAQSNRSTSRLYDHVDTEENNGIAFYRIRSETNGQAIYSQAVPYFTGSKPPAFTVFPNPIVDNYCMILTDTDEPLSYELFDVNSAKIDVASNTTGISGMTTLLLNPSIVNGMYYLRIRGKDIFEVKTLWVHN